MSLVFYRKHRPQKFSEFIGQEHIVQTITNAIKNNTVSHAYLFSGPRGTGKTTLARLLAKAVNCQNLKGYEPCNKCSSCLEIFQGSSMDLIEIDAASHRGIDDIRNLREGIRFVPFKEKRKVFIIDECHQLSKDASNALLKTLEEPPSHAIFILATTEIHKMIPTIISRCQRFDFRKLKIPEIIKKLESICQKEKIEAEKTALTMIAQAARGSFRDAESLLAQAFAFAGGDKKIEAEEIKEILGLVETTVISNFTNFIIEKDKKGAIDFLNNSIEQGIDIQEFSKAVVGYLRQGLILIMTGEGKLLASHLTKEEIGKLKEQTRNINEKKLSQILENFLKATNKIKYSPIPQLPIELAIIDSCEIE